MSVVTPSGVLCVGSPSKLLRAPRGQQRDRDLQAEGSLQEAVASRGMLMASWTGTLVPFDLGEAAGMSKAQFSRVMAIPAPPLCRVRKTFAPGPAVGCGIALSTVGKARKWVHPSGKKVAKS